MENTQLEYVTCSLKLEQADYSDKTAPIIIKTHNYKGKKTREFNAKLYDVNSLNYINKNMFKPFHIIITGSDDEKTIASSKEGNIELDFILTFLKNYNKGEFTNTVKVLYNMRTLKPTFKQDKFLDILIKKFYYSSEEVKIIVEGLKNFVINREANKPNGKDIWLSKDLNTYIKENLEILYK